MFHAFMRKSEEFYKRIDTDPEYNPVRSMADKVMTHHSSEQRDPIYPEIHCILAVLISPNFGDAVSEVASVRHCSGHGARTAIQKALDAGPEFTAEEREILYGKGLLYAGGRYYTVNDKFKKDGRYDQISRLVPADRAPVLDTALTQWLSRSSKHNRIVTIAETDLIFIATQLLPDGREKEIKLNELSLQTGEKFYKVGLAESRAIIHAIADHLKLPIPSGLLGEDCPRRTKQKGLQKPINPKNLASRPFTQAGSEKPAPVSVPARAEEDRDPLYKALKSLKDEGKISTINALAYYKLHGPKLDKIQSPKEVAAWVEQQEGQAISPNIFLMRMAAVKKQLQQELTHKNIPLSSNGNLHEARAVRP